MYGVFLINDMSLFTFDQHLDNQALKYIVNKLITSRKSCRRVMFQDYKFEIFLKAGKFPVSLHHFTQAEIGEQQKMDDNFPNAQVMKDCVQI